VYLPRFHQWTSLFPFDTYLDLAQAMHGGIFPSRYETFQLTSGNLQICENNQNVNKHV
jgi:hypothetical protein